MKQSKFDHNCKPSSSVITFNHEGFMSNSNFQESTKGSSYAIFQDENQSEIMRKSSSKIYDYQIQEAYQDIGNQKIIMSDSQDDLINFNDTCQYDLNFLQRVKSNEHINTLNSQEESQVIGRKIIFD